MDPLYTADKFARELHDIWGVGDKHCHNGVLLLISLGDRVLHISTGKGARETLNDETASIIVGKPL
jgi:uncharacterized membrane protein YgcG